MYRGERPKSKPEGAEEAESAERTTPNGAEGFCQFRQEFDSVSSYGRSSDQSGAPEGVRRTGGAR